MSFDKIKGTVRLFICYLPFAILPSCDSSGQKNLDDSDWNNRRKVPDLVMAALPTAPDTLTQSTHFQWFGYGAISLKQVDTIAAEIEETITEIESFSGKQLGRKKFKWYLYASPEMKGLLLKDSSPNQVDHATGSVHTIVNDVFSDHYFGVENEILLAETLGSIPESNLFRVGTALYFTKNWQKKGYQYWAPKLHEAGQLPSVAALLDNNNWKPSSDLIFGSAAAAFCRFLIETRGKAFFLEKYRNGTFSTDELDSLESSWQQHCANWQIQKANPVQKALPYLKGFNFAHEGYRIYNGYGSGKALQSLQHLKNLGTNAVAIVPYSFARFPKEPHPIPVVKQPGSENDESVIQSAEDAQSLGMTVVLKPQIWVGRGLWTGDIDMQSEEDWEQFFRHYGHWACHYAILSEIYGWEMFCIGTELVQTTAKRENDWREVIGSARSLYGGWITYAANWGDEFENLSLWDDLDYIGLNCYYPLSDKDAPSDRELKRGFDSVIEKIERVCRKHDKPLIFTEIGFPCIKAPWKAPHNDWGDFEPDSEHQRRCYEIVFNAINGRPWCQGILWWKYPSDLEHGRRRETGFSPHGTPSEGVVARWFGKHE